MTLFGTAGIRGPVEADVTPRLAVRVGQAVGRDAEACVLGLDGRVTSPALANACAAGLQSTGTALDRAGRVPTPALAFASRGRHGIMVTASHNPAADNGFKLFVDGVEYDRDAESRVADRVAGESAPAAWGTWTTASRRSPLPAYREAVLSYVAKHGSDPAGLSVAIDCGNGMGAAVTPDLLRAAGADVRALEANVDGTFPARASKPTAESLEALSAFVETTDVALGLAHDGDADRLVVLDGSGAVVHEDTVLAVIAEHYVTESGAGDPVVVTTPNASARVDDRVDAAGGRVERVGLGALHEGVAGVSGTVVFAAEPWKHLHPAFGGWIDGVVSAVLLTRLLAAEDLATRRDPVRELPYRKVSVECPESAKARVMDHVESALPERFPEAAVDTEYGVRLDRPDGSWVLVRPSGTEPVVRVYAEGTDPDALLDPTLDVVRGAVEAPE